MSVTDGIERDLPEEVLISNGVEVVGERLPEDAVTPLALIAHFDEQTTEIAGRQVLTKIAAALMELRSGKIPSEDRMSPPQATILRAVRDRKAARLSLTRLYHRICDERMVKPDSDDRLSLIALAQRVANS